MFGASATRVGWITFSQQHSNTAATCIVTRIYKKKTPTRRILYNKSITVHVAPRSLRSKKAAAICAMELCSIEYCIVSHRTPKCFQIGAGVFWILGTFANCRSLYSVLVSVRLLFCLSPVSSFKARYATTPAILALLLFY